MESDEERVEELLHHTPKGAAIMMYETENAGTAANTAIGFDTDDIEAEVVVLRGRGVTAEEFYFCGIEDRERHRDDQRRSCGLVQGHRG